MGKNMLDYGTLKNWNNTRAKAMNRWLARSNDCLSKTDQVCAPMYKRCIITWNKRQDNTHIMIKLFSRRGTLNRALPSLYHTSITSQSRWAIHVEELRSQMRPELLPFLGKIPGCLIVPQTVELWSTIKYQANPKKITKSFNKDPRRRDPWWGTLNHLAKYEKLTSLEDGHTNLLLNPTK